MIPIGPTVGPRATPRFGSGAADQALTDPLLSLLEVEDRPTGVIDRLGDRADHLLREVIKHRND